MKKILLSFLVVFLLGALVISCDSNAKNISDETATVSFATSMGRSLSAQVSYIGFDQLDWEYQATLTSDTGFTYGETEWASINLSDTREFSQGLWKFELRAKTKGDNPQVVFYGDKDGVLIKKQSTPIPVLINVSPVSGGTGTISFEKIDIIGKTEGQKNTANKAELIVNGETRSIDISSASQQNPVSVNVPSGTYSVIVSYVQNYGANEGEFVVSGSETIDIQVYSGANVRISGNIAEGTQSAILNPSLEVPETVFAKQLPVSITSQGAVVTVSKEKEIKNDTLVVTYPEGTLLKESNADSVTNTADAVTGFKYVSDTPSSSGITVSASESVAQYELTLNVDEDNSVLLKVEKLIEKDLFITKVLHDGNELAKTQASEGEPAREYYSYDEETGKLTLYLFHASPIDIITLDTSLLPENAKIVMNLEELETAVGNLHDGDYIAFGANIVQDKVDTTSGQITFAKADGVKVPITATLDLNGFMFDGQIGGFSFSNNDLTMIIHGTEKAVADYYEHETGHHMVKACAIFLYSGNYNIKDGLFKSNNATIFSYGGEITIDDGEFVQTSNGVVIGACNDGSTTINGGKFKVEGSEGALFSLETFSDNKYPVLTINGGEFTTVGTNSYCFVIEEGNGPKCEVVINGGTFELENINGLASYTPSSSTSKTEDQLNEMVKNSISIKGGTFNVDPSAYVDTANYNVTDNGSTWTVTAK